MDILYTIKYQVYQRKTVDDRCVERGSGTGQKTGEKLKK